MNRSLALRDGLGTGRPQVLNHSSPQSRPAVLAAGAERKVLVLSLRRLGGSGSSGDENDPKQPDLNFKLRDFPNEWIIS